MIVSIHDLYLLLYLDQICLTKYNSNIIIDLVLLCTVICEPSHVDKTVLRSEV